MIGVNVIPSQERPNRCALYYSCACDFEVVNGNARLCINKPFFLGKAFASGVELLDTK